MTTFIHHLSSTPPSIPSALETFLHAIRFSNPSNVEETLPRAYNSLLTLVASTPHTNGGQNHLVEFLLELRKAKNPTSEVKIWGEKFKWENLPLWGPSVREVWDVAEPDPNSPNTTQEAKDHWVNQNAFLALLTSYSPRKDDALDFALYGIWASRSAFEEEVEVEKVEGWVLETASVWLVYAGKELKERSEKGEKWEGRIARGGARFEGKGWTGLGSERWGVWVEGLTRGAKAAGGKENGVVGDALKVADNL